MHSNDNGNCSQRLLVRERHSASAFSLGSHWITAITRYPLVLPCPTFPTFIRTPAPGLRSSKVSCAPRRNLSKNALVYAAITPSALRAFAVLRGLPAA